MNTTTTNNTSPITGCGVTRAAVVMDRAVGSGSSAIVMRCRRGSGSFTDRAETIVISAPSSATVIGWPVALVSRNRTSSAVASAPVVRVAIRSRSRPGSDPIIQLRARSYSAVASPSTRGQPLVCVSVATDSGTATKMGRDEHANDAGRWP